jgi:antitoxin component of MazEF toxin-antitoxin module
MTKLVQIGNDVGVLLDRALLDQLGWADDEEVQIEVKGREIWVTPTLRKVKR